MVEEAMTAHLAKQIITTDESFMSDMDTLYVSKEVMAKLSFTKTPQPFGSRFQKRRSASIM